MKALRLVRTWIITYWYVIVFIVTTIFVVRNFDKCLELTFTENFNGTHLIFVFWLILAVFPFFESFEGFGISLKKQKVDIESGFEEEKFLEEVNNIEKQEVKEDE